MSTHAARSTANVTSNRFFFNRFMRFRISRFRITRRFGNGRFGNGRFGNGRFGNGRFGHERHGIVTAFVKRIAATQAFQAEPAAAPQAQARDRFISIVRASGIKPARSGQGGRNRALINPYQKQSAARHARAVARRRNCNIRRARLRR